MTPRYAKILFFLLLTGNFAVPIMAKPIASPNSWVIFRVGEVQVKRGKKVYKALPSVARTNLKVGDEIRTKSGSRADVHLGRFTVIRMKENTVIKLKKLQIQKDQFIGYVKLTSGKVLVKVKKKLSKDSRFAVLTPVAVAAVRGTVFVVDVDQKTSSVQVLEGVVHSANLVGESGSGDPIEGKSEDIEAGKEIEFKDDASFQEREITPGEMESDTNWTQEPEYSASVDSESNSPGEEASPRDSTGSDSSADLDD